MSNHTLIDARLIELLNVRALISSQTDVDLNEKISLLNKGPLTDEDVSSIYKIIQKRVESRIAVPDTTLPWTASSPLDESVAYLGPPGSYSYEAARKGFPSTQPASLLECTSFINVFSSIKDRRSTSGIVPIENSTFGSVVGVFDCLRDLSASISPRSGLTVAEVVVTGEVYLSIHHCLLSSAHVSGSTTVKRIYSHSQALGQCQAHLERHFPGVERVPTSSTSAAAQLASKDPEALAIASKLCADLWGLLVVKEGIEDRKDNTTRFLILSESLDLPEQLPAQHYSTLIKFTLDHEQPGSLADILYVFKKNNLNLRKIDTRPSLVSAWDYVFFVEVDGHLTAVSSGLLELQNLHLTRELVIVGCFQRSS